jgi:hypothetical protein
MNIPRPLQVLAMAVAVLAAAGGTAQRSPAAALPVANVTQQRTRLPSAAEFARFFVGATNKFAMDHGAPVRIGLADCVQASRGHYMCSYESTRPGAPPQCHLMQARWTPRADSTITVTLAGRTARCGSLREAIDSIP